MEMAIVALKCNGDVKLEDSSREGSSGEAYVTYTRRKRPRPSATGSLAGGQVSHMITYRPKSRDIGWDHGERIEGNRFHWKCKWCGMVRCSGGVSRLKQHLAGGWHVAKCLKVPEDIANTMKQHLLEMKTKNRFRRKKAKGNIDKIKSESPDIDDLVDKYNGQIGLEMQVGNATQQFESAAKRFWTSSQRSRAAYIRSRTHTQRPKYGVAKYMKKLDSTMLNGSTYGKDAVARTGTHWRSVLENMLRLPDLSEGGGVQSCIRSALKSNPPGFTRKAKMAEASEDTAKPKDRSVDYCETHGQYPRPDISTNATLDGSNTEIHGQAKLNINTAKCQHAFLDILRSEQFALLCNLLCGSFQDSKIEKLFDFSLINSNMKNGEYEQSPRSFDKDIQKIWKKFQEIGQEMFSLASSLSTVSRASYQKQVGENLVHEASELKHEASQIVGDQKNSNVSHTTMQFPCESDRSTKPDQTEASGLYKVCTCKQCGSETDGKRRLICDGCEAVYHFSCAEPAIQEIPFRSWYCASCNKDRSELPQPFQPSTQQDGLHGNCVVCDRLEVCETEKQFEESGSMAIPDDSRESSVSSMESEEPPEPSSTALSRLCKKCGTCEDEDKRFLTCGNSHCPYRFYHIICLRSSQIASPQQRNRHCWYCPSCLCRACLNDKDDDKIVLCDGCDEAYHIYCMKPPRTSIPKGQWFCVQCSAARAREGMRMYEQWILQQHGKKDANKSIETNRPMDVLLSAVDKLSSEEQLESRVKGEK